MDNILPGLGVSLVDPQHRGVETVPLVYICISREFLCAVNVAVSRGRHGPGHQCCRILPVIGGQFPGGGLYAVVPGHAGCIVLIHSAVLEQHLVCHAVILCDGTVEETSAEGFPVIRAAVSRICPVPVGCHVCVKAVVAAGIIAAVLLLDLLYAPFAPVVILVVIL